ncbi:MAG: hypothetical protein QOH97_5217 [Actinoplanes sp.]|nr:hypothetical protein [Actinoplanes sp.]
MIDRHDVTRLLRLVNLLVDSDASTLMGAVLGAGSAGVPRGCRLRHGGILVFPERVEDVHQILTSIGCAVSPAVPSVIVTRRLAGRYGVESASLPVVILTGQLPDCADVRQIEVFVLATDDDGLPAGVPLEDIVARERAGEHETHIAFEVDPPVADHVAGLTAHLGTAFGMVPDGGGYNPHEQPESGGRSVFYFSSAAEADGRGERSNVHRIEICAAGHWPDLLAAHERDVGRDTRDAGQPTGHQGPPRGDDIEAAGTRLLELMTGTWRAQAVYATATAGIADALAAGPATPAEVAAAAGCDIDATTRLLRFLGAEGVLTRHADGRYEAGVIGTMLQAGSPFRALVELYGSEFHRAWGHFADAVRTGETAFRHGYGVEHFEYFRGHLEVGRRFDRAMSATTSLLADRIPEIMPLNGAPCVVDIGGGDGTLLSAVLLHNPFARGVLADQENVLADLHPAAREHLASGRLSVRPTDFFHDAPGGGDVYLLSRILHDWSDVECAVILGNVRAVMRPDDRLLVIERVLPAGLEPSLAGLWDLQMLAVTGGRERSEADYTRLLAAAGLAPAGREPLGLGLYALVAQPVADRTRSPEVSACP